MSKIILITIIIIVLVIVALGAYVILSNSNTEKSPADQNQNTDTNNIKKTNETISIIQGMKVEITKEGSGEGAKNGNLVSVHYTGTLANGTTFDSSVDRNAPFSFILGQGKVIRGWDLGVIGMKVGEKRKLIIPPDLAYGANGFPPIIPKSAILMFDIEMLKIN